MQDYQLVNPLWDENLLNENISSKINFPHSTTTTKANIQTIKIFCLLFELVTNHLYSLNS